MELHLAVGGALLLCEQAPTLRVGYFYVDVVTGDTDWRVRVRLPRSGKRSPLDAYVATVSASSGEGTERLTVHEDDGRDVHAALTRRSIERDTYIGSLWGVQGCNDSCAYRTPSTAVPAVRATVDQSELLMLIGAIHAMGQTVCDPKTWIVTLEGVQCSGLISAWMSNGDYTDRRFVFALPYRERQLVQGTLPVSSTPFMPSGRQGVRAQPMGMATPLAYWMAVSRSVQLLACDHLVPTVAGAFISFSAKSVPPVLWINTGLLGETEAVCVATHATHATHAAQS
jgi:hypothetical protein